MFFGMKRNSLTGLVAGLSLMVGVSWYAQTSASSSNRISQDTSTSLVDALSDKKVNEMSLQQVQSSLVEYMNIVRTQHGLHPLTLYQNSIAQDHSTYLHTSKEDIILSYEDHFDSDGNSIYTRVEHANIPIDTDCRWDCKRVGENIASSNMTIKQTVEMWLESPDHAANVLWISFNAVAVWCAAGGNNIVADFLNLK